MGKMIWFLTGRMEDEALPEEYERWGQGGHILLVGDTSQCEHGETGDVEEEVAQVPDHVTWLMVWLSCYDNPASHCTIWAAHSRAALTAISTL